MWITQSYLQIHPGMLSPRNGLGLEARNYGLGLRLGLVASGLGLRLVDAVASASWLHCSVKNIALCSDFSVSSVYLRDGHGLDPSIDWIGLNWIL